MVASIVVLVLVVLGSGSSSDSGVATLVPFAWVTIITWIVTALTARRAAEQSPALRMCPGTATVFIARPPEQVWAFIRPAETTPQIQQTVRRGFSVPGTPRGVGEQQCFVSDAPFGRLQAEIVEVTAEQAGRLAVVRNVTGPPVRQQYELAQANGGTDLTYSIELSAMRWAVYNVHPKKQATAAAETYVASVKRLVESQPPFEPPAGVSASPPPNGPT
jgi:hypothetical protein